MNKLIQKLKALPWWAWLLILLPAGWLIFLWYSAYTSGTKSTLPASQATPGPSTSPAGTPVGNGPPTNAN